MSGDYSRDTKRGYSGVLMQQGRVQLDADWNDQLEINLRRQRFGTIDTIGRGTVPRQTPQGFEITLASGPSWMLNIGPGRIYVDGLLAENQGRNPTFDGALGEDLGSSPIAYSQQPYFPNSPPLPASGPHLVYLDVWQREVTCVEQPEILEPALGGVDTTTRLQTVWQVRILPVGADVRCDTPDDRIRPWYALIHRSPGRLSTARVPTHEPADLCRPITPGSDPGFENRLYRVEIHDGGAAGTATFKWSRHNASIASQVTDINATRDTLTVVRLGRDAELRFNPGDWIELTDDWQEFAQQPGVMGRVLRVNEATQQITLEAPIPPTAAFASTPVGHAERHTRVRRWDHQVPAGDTSGVLQVPASATPVQLGTDGVQITFTLSGEYRVGDYWTFVTRSVPPYLEILAEAPPRGVTHHYCRLALVTFGEPAPAPLDCRVLWPPASTAVESCCACTLCVTPESHRSGTLTIQQAIDRVKSSGGTVCLDVGEYDLGNRPLLIAGAISVRIRGQGIYTRLNHSGGGSAVAVLGCWDLTIENLALVGDASAGGPDPVIAMADSSYVTVERVAIRPVDIAVPKKATVGLGGSLMAIELRGNVLVATIGITKLQRGPEPGTIPGATTLRRVEGLIIEGNTFQCDEQAVLLEMPGLELLRLSVTGNDVKAWSKPPGGSDEAHVSWRDAALGISGDAQENAGVNIRDNTILTGAGGIGVAVIDARIESNSVARFGDAQSGHGIVLDASGGSIDRCQVLNNRITGLRGCGMMLSGAKLRSAMIKNNIIEQVQQGGVVMEEEAAAAQLTIENNHLFGITGPAAKNDSDLFGIRVVAADRAEIVGNSIIGLQIGSPNEGIGLVGIQARNGKSVRFEGNQVVNIGSPTQLKAEAVGLECRGVFEQVDVSDNTVRRNLQPPAASGSAPWIALRIGPIQSKQPAGGDKTAEPEKDGASNPAEVVAKRETPFRGEGVIGVQGNYFEAYGPAPLVQIVARGVLTFSQNRCRRVAQADDSTTSIPLVSAEVGACILTANYLEGAAGQETARVRLPDGAPFTLLANIASGKVVVNRREVSAPTTLPWGPLNVVTS